MHLLGGAVEVFAYVAAAHFPKPLQIKAGKKAPFDLQLDAEITREFDLDSPDANLDLDLSRVFPIAGKINYCSAHTPSELELPAAKVTQAGDLERPHAVFDNHAVANDRIGRQHRQLGFTHSGIKIQLLQFQSAEIDHILTDTGLHVNL